MPATVNQLLGMADKKRVRQEWRTIKRIRLGCDVAYHQKRTREYSTWLAVRLDPAFGLDKKGT